MCGLFGIMSEHLREDEVETLVRIAENARERGTDAVGWAIINMDDGGITVHRSLTWDRAMLHTQLSHQRGEPVIIIGNVRAEPTTEWFGGEDPVGEFVCMRIVATDHKLSRIAAVQRPQQIHDRDIIG